jgi:guanylate kinase
MSKGGKLIVFSAPSGSGKTTIVRHLLSQEDLNLEFSISASRESRGEEMEKIITSFQLKNSNNTSRMTTFWNGKKFTETISTEL